MKKRGHHGASVARRASRERREVAAEVTHLRDIVSDLGNMEASPGSPDARAALTPELVAFIESGVIGHAATRTSTFEPEEMLIAGLRAGAGGRVATLFLSEGPAAATVANVRDNGELAVTVVRVTDNRSLQLKGKVIAVRTPTEDERRFQAGYMERLTAELTLVGVPRSVGARMIWWPSVALDFEIRDLFDQTPGPGAGRRVAEGAR